MLDRFNHMCFGRLSRLLHGGELTAAGIPAYFAGGHEYSFCSSERKIPDNPSQIMQNSLRHKITLLI
ncbi:MAG: hypothetical protein Q8K29_12250 [Polaromonas sp.]|nr:hypothetical protein [Polaromonas sp.]